ncbi:MAG TPA: hypothetical protein VHL09_12565, partial [Dehalococcoidia bacterium]|nr:hypothetical protein [Dehalococcoidia bacterium]
FDRLLIALTEFSPAFEPVGLGQVVIDIGGLAGLHGTGDALAAKLLGIVQRGAPGPGLGWGPWTADCQPRIGLATDRFVAEVAARRTPPGSWRLVALGTEREFLAPLSVRYLPGSAETHRRLRLFGLRRIEQVAAIPTGDLMRQFGAEGRLLADRSRGIDPRPITPWAPPPEVAERVTFESPPQTWDELLLCCGLAAQQVAVDLGFEGSGRILQVAHLEWQTGRVDLPQPTARPLDLIRAVHRAVRRAVLSPPPHSRRRPDFDFGPFSAAERGKTSPPALGPDVPVLCRGVGRAGLVHLSRTLQGGRTGRGGGPGGEVPSPLVEAWIRFSGIVAERGVQLSFFRGSPITVRATIADLQARWGPGVIKQAAIVAPWARLAGRRFVWRPVQFDHGSRPADHGQRKRLRP